MTTTSHTVGRLLRPSCELHADVTMWLNQEAELLDRQEFTAWLERLAPDIRYVMPVRATVHRMDGSGVFRTNHHLDETYGTLGTRVRRLVEATNYAEDPPSRTRRFVTNIRVFEPDGNDVAASSYLLLLRSRGETDRLELLSCERNDLFHQTDAGLRLAAREIIVDQSTLGVVHLGVPL